MLGDIARLRHIRTILSSADASPVGAQAELAIRMADIMLTRATSGPAIDRAFTEKILALLEGWQSAETFALLRNQIMHSGREALKAPSQISVAPLFALLAELQTAIIAAGDEAAKALLGELLAIEGGRFEAMKAAALAPFGAEQAAEGEAAPVAATFDPEAVTQFLRLAHPDETEVTVAKWSTFASGLSKTTMLLELAHTSSLPSSIVLRKDSGAVHSAGSVKSEFELLEALFNRGVQVPQPLACDTEGSALGAPFITVTKREGAIIGDLLRLSPGNPELCRNIARELARVHSLEASDVGSVLPAPLHVSATDWVAQMIEEDYQSWTALGIVDPIYETAYAWLRANVTLNDQAPLALVHGDFGLQNILVAENSVSAILDWEFATLGCAAYDMGYFFDQAEALGSWDDFCEAYAQEAGSLPDRKLLDYHILLSAARFGAMGHRMHKHLDSVAQLDGPSSGIVCAFFIEEFAGRVARAIQRALK